MILECQHISKAFGADEILNDISFHLEEKEKMALIGINGAGKSTLLKIIMQKISPDGGSVVLSKNSSVGYLAQYQDVSGERTIYEEVLSSKEEVIAMEAQLRVLEEKMQGAQEEELSQLLSQYHRLSHAFEMQDGYAYKSEVTGILRGLGFLEPDFDRPVSALSGGQKTRVFLGTLLAGKPDLLILDEPTNHLDLSSIAWLESFLSNYRGAVLIVSHDRYFLDRIVTKIVELEHHKASVFRGNYSAYAQKKAALREAQQRAWQNQQQEIKHQEEVIARLKSFNREKSIKRAESREKLLGKMERLEKPETQRADMKIRLTAGQESGNDVLTVEGLEKAFGANLLFSDLSFAIKRGECVALIGDNGTGKTTILKIINELLPQDAGNITIGTNIHIGYYDQEHQLLHEENTLFEEISDLNPQLNNTQIRSLLASFLFTDEDVFKRIGELSGGERGRVSLAKLMLSKANFLILDEPTNHLDLVSKEVLEEALNQYDGTVFFVSHDRYFINKTATRILELTQKQIVNYPGNYDYYLEKRDGQAKLLSSVQTVSEETGRDDSGKNEWKQRRQKQAKARKREAGLKRTEEAIAQKEAQKKMLEEEMQNPEIATDANELLRLDAQISALDQELLLLYGQWESLAEE